MTNRARLYQLIDALTESALPAAERYLVALRDGPMAGLPEDNEPLTPEEEAMLAASREAIARGVVLTQDELRARRAASRGSA